MDPDQPLPRELEAADFTPLGRVITREEGLRVVRWAERAPSVREWLLCQVRTGATARGLVGRSSAALVDLRFDLGVLPELLGDTLGAYRFRSCVRPGRAGPRRSRIRGNGRSGIANPRAAGSGRTFLIAPETVERSTQKTCARKTPARAGWEQAARART